MYVQYTADESLKNMKMFIQKKPPQLYKPVMSLELSEALEISFEVWRVIVS